MTFIIFSIIFRSILAGEGDMKFPVMVAAIGTILNKISDIEISSSGYEVLYEPLGR